MKVKELIKMLEGLNQEARIDISSDEEGNSFGDVSDSIAEGLMAGTGEQVYSLYPETCEQPEDRYDLTDSLQEWEKINKIGAPAEGSK